MTRHIASVLQRHHSRSLGGLLLLLGGLALVGCYIVSPEDQATAEDVDGQSFVFANGAVFHTALANAKTTLAFSNNANNFTLTSAGGEASGGNRFGSCILTVTTSNYTAGDGPQQGDVITLEPCDFDSSDKTLSVGRGSIEATSEPSSSEGTGTSTTNQQATASDLNNRSFSFANGAAFDSGLATTATTLMFTDSARSFALSSSSIGRTASGTHNFGSSSCILTFSESNYLSGQGPQVGSVVTLSRCTFNSTNTTLTVTNNGVTRTSTTAVAVP